jgi:hypothetical protein
MVGEYQVINLPCPAFREARSRTDNVSAKSAITAVNCGDLDAVLQTLQPDLQEPPFSPAVRNTIVALADHIVQAERSRGEISRAERSALSSEAQPYQDLIDRLFYVMAGLTDDEAKSLEERLSKML